MSDEEPTHYRHRMHGQLGRLIFIDGKRYIRLDRANEEIDIPYHQSEWIPEREIRKLNRFHAAMVSFAADKALCAALGMGDHARLDWQTLDIEARQAWEAQGPGRRADKLRLQLFEAVNKVLEDHVLKG